MIRTEIDGYDFSVQASNYDSISWDFGDGQFSDQESIFHTYQVDQEFTIQLSIFSKNNCQKIEFSYNIDTYNVSDVEGFQSRANVYPNPSSRFFYVNIEEASTIFVFNLDGKKIIETAKDKSFKLDLNEVKNGVYFVRIINQNGVQNYKLIKNE